MPKFKIVAYKYSHWKEGLIKDNQEEIVDTENWNMWNPSLPWFTEYRALILFAYTGYEFAAKLVGKLIKPSITCRDVSRMHYAMRELIVDCRNTEAYKNYLQILARPLILKQWIIQIAATFEVVAESPARGEFRLQSDEKKIRTNLPAYQGENRPGRSEKETEWAYTWRKEAINTKLIMDVAHATSRYPADMAKEKLLRLL